MENLYVKLSTGEGYKVLKNGDGSMYYFNREGEKKKVRKNQHVYTVQTGDVEGAAGEHMFAAVSELFRAKLPSTQQIWIYNENIDKYTRFSKDQTEKLNFKDLSKVVVKFEDYDEERALKVERDHIVEVQIVSHAWHRGNKGRQPNTRAALKVIRDNVNALPNLNCTPGVINMKKESAVRKFLSNYEGNGRGLRDHLQEYGVGPNTTRRICTTYEEAANQIADEVQKEGKDVYDDFADEITLLLGYMKLD